MSDADADRFVNWARERLSIVIEVVTKRPDQRGFEVLPHRWVVERALAWITKCRRCNAAYERKREHAEAMIPWAMIGRAQGVRATARRVYD